MYNFSTQANSDILAQARQSSEAFQVRRDDSWIELVIACDPSFALINDLSYFFVTGLSCIDKVTVGGKVLLGRIK